MSKARGSITIFAFAGLSILALGGCSEVRMDRAVEAGGAEVDYFADSSEVTVWRSPDKVPNIVTFCADGRAWVATLNASDTGRGQLLRDEERDDRCLDKANPVRSRDEELE